MQTETKNREIGDLLLITLKIHRNAYTVCKATLICKSSKTSSCHIAKSALCVIDNIGMPYEYYTNGDVPYNDSPENSRKVFSLITCHAKCSSFPVCV